jgi:hypothetical protein
MRISIVYAGLLAIVCLPAAPRQAAAQDAAGAAGGESPEDTRWPIDPEAAPRPTLTAIPAGGAIDIDGVLDEAPWAAATPATDFIQSTPNTGHPASERTEVRVLYDDHALYIGAMLYDSDPGAIIAQQMVQDFFSPNEDVFGFSLDTFLDRRNAYYILINANGAIRDAQSYDNSRTSNVEWEGIMYVETAIGDDGWSVEMSIPFSTLRFDPSRPVQEWGLNFVRRVRRKNEDSLWAPVARRTRVHKMDEAGTLVGLPRLRGSRNVTVKPYALGGDVSGAGPAQSDLGLTGDFGVDVKWGVTPRMTADLTWRTDFSQVEADQEQVNLTRFGQFFPEKREFFIESSGTYQFGDLSERNYRLGASPRDFTLFHSRRIGLEGGRPVPILGGARMTGRIGNVEVGVLSMQTESTAAFEAESFTVTRARRTLFDALDVGGIFINRQTIDGSDSYNRSWGVDANARLAGNLVLHSYFAQTHEPGSDGDNRAARVSAAWRDALWDTSVLFRTIGDAFQPGVGFVRRGATRHWYGTVGIHPRVGPAFVNEINPYMEVERYTDLDGRLETRNLTGALAVAFMDGGMLTVQGTDRFEWLTDDFVLSGGTVPAGSYDFREASASYVSNAALSLSGQIRVSGGGYFQGERRSVGGSLVWRPMAKFGVDVGADHNVIDLEGEPFTVDVFSARLDYSWSTKLLAGAWVQYNDATEELVTNVRLNYVHAPLSDLFFVYSERRGTTGGPVIDRRFTVKLTKLFAF